MIMPVLSNLRLPTRGLTLVEIMVAVGILGVLVAVAVPSMTDLLERRRVIAAADELVSVLNYAKAETNSTNSVLIVRFDPDPDNAMSCAAVTTGQEGLSGTCACYLPANTICQGLGLASPKLLRNFQLPKTNVKFDASGTWAATAYQLRFSRAEGMLATTGFRVDVVGLKRLNKLRVEVNTAGRVRICSPNGDFSGYAQCA